MVTKRHLDGEAYLSNELDYEAEGNGLGIVRVLVIGLGMVVGFVVGVVIAFALSGCATFDNLGGMEALDELAQQWKDKLEAMASTTETPEVKPPVEETKPPVAEPVTAGDAVPFSSLTWQYGGFMGFGAVLDSPRLSNAKCNGRAIFYKWDVGLSGWGLGHSDPGAICCIFFERDAKWVGGKFDWVSTSRTNRELKHVESYSDWPTSGIKLPWRGRVVFVVVSADGKMRSNVISAEAK